MLHYIENEIFKVGVESKGAELQHFIKKNEDLELIWVADPAIWGSHSPVLFPIVGELPNGEYTFDGKVYQMQRHGFARRKEFSLVQASENKLVFELTYDKDTLEQYPFKFRLFVAYKLEDNRLSVTYQVTNIDDKGMYFSIGAHPGFNVPLFPNEKYTDYYLEFEQSETLNRYLINDEGLQTGGTTRLLTDDKVLPLRHELFEKDAIILKDLKSTRVALQSKTGVRRIEMNFKGFPYLGIWAKPGASPYVCLEPWCGIASHAGDSGKLEEKEGMQKLSPKSIFERTFALTVE